MLYIDRQAIVDNLSRLRENTTARICAVVKCDGYGLGLEPYAGLLKDNGIDFFATTEPGEAMRLRALGIRDDILLLSPVYDAETIRALAEQQIQLQIGSVEQIEAMEWALVGTGFKMGVHLALETGFGRWGFSMEELTKNRARLRRLTVEGCYSHLASPWKDPAFTRHQAYRFEKTCCLLRELGIQIGMRHLCASGGFFQISRAAHGYGAPWVRHTRLHSAAERVWAEARRLSSNPAAPNQNDAPRSTPWLRCWPFSLARYPCRFCWGGKTRRPAASTQSL